MRHRLDVLGRAQPLEGVDARLQRRQQHLPGAHCGANLVEGEIEIREDGIEDQMQDDYSWDGAEAQGRQDQDENAYESERASAERGGDSRRSDASTTRQHDGELHVVA